MLDILICEHSLTNCADKFLKDYNLTIALSIDDILDLTYTNNYDIIIINYFFIENIKELKSYLNNTKIVFIDDYYDIKHLEQSLKVGDEYIINALVYEEIAIRINYIYRQIYKTKNSVIKFSNFFYKTNTKQLYLKDKLIKLSPNELKLVHFFILNISQPIDKNRLYELLNNFNDGTLRVYISRLKNIGLNMQYLRSINSYILKVK